MRQTSCIIHHSYNVYIGNDVLAMSLNRYFSYSSSEKSLSIVSKRAERTNITAQVLYALGECAQRHFTYVD